MLYKYGFLNNNLSISELAKTLNATRQSLDNNHNCAIKKYKKRYKEELESYL